MVVKCTQELYPDKELVSPAPGGGRTDWFDPFFEVGSNLNKEKKYSQSSRPVNGWVAGLIIWLPMTMMVMWTMSWRNLRSCTIGGANLRKLDKGKRQKQNFLNGQIGSTLCGCEIFVEAHFTESNYNR